MALSAHGIPRDKVFSQKISTRIKARPQFEKALAIARQIKAHAPRCRVIFTVHEMKCLGRDASELTALADHQHPGGPAGPDAAGSAAARYGGNAAGPARPGRSRGNSTTTVW